MDQLAARAMTADIDGDSVPEVLFARQDGFINVFRLDDGFNLGRISVGEPIIGMTVLTGQHGKPRIVVGTRFGVQVFGTDLKMIGGVSLPARRPLSPARAARTRTASTSSGLTGRSACL